jgi:two-component system OmpR family response regulator
MTIICFNGTTIGEINCMNVLIVEDDGGVARFLNQACQEAGYATDVVGDGLVALARAKNQRFDLILLDAMLPSLNGFDVCRQLRGAGVNSLILMITARDTLEDKIAGLDAGADDYLCKPFRVAEILARMRALLRRREPGKLQLRVGDLILDANLRQASRDGQTIRLSQTEYTLLEYLMRNVGKIMPRSLILEHVWQYDFSGSDNVLDVYIGYLRNKIDKNRVPLIHTVRGVGYRMGTE